MFPLSDSTPRKSFPFINYLIIAVCIFVFYLELSAPDTDAFIAAHAFIPSQSNIFSLATYYNVLWSIFLHGGFMHIISNMWFLWIFGDNIEDALGHIPYLLFYLVGGIVSMLAQYAIAPYAPIPLIGASGAIAAAAGMYFVLYKNSKVKTLVVFFFGLFDIVNIPVWIFLGYWFLLQLFNEIGSFTSVDTNAGGVAYMAHVGGFIFGLVLGQFVKRDVVPTQEMI